MVRSLTLMYHAVSDAWDDAWRSPSASSTGCSLGSFAAAVVERPPPRWLARPSDPRLLHVTFDDAFASVQNALPTLRRLRIPATIFVCTDLAAGGAPLAVAELDRVTQRDELRTLDWDALRAMSEDELIEIGSHTRTHAHLPRLSDAELRRSSSARRRRSRITWDGRRGSSHTRSERRANGSAVRQRRRATRPRSQLRDHLCAPIRSGCRELGSGAATPAVGS